MKIKKKLNPGELIIVWSGITILWFAYRYHFILPESIDELLIKPIIFIIPVTIYLKFKRKLTLDNLGLRVTNWNTTVFWGVGLGLFFVMENQIIWLIKGATINQKMFLDIRLIILSFFISFSTALSEEILYRGFLLNQLSRIFKSSNRLNLLVAFLFTYAHLAISFLVLGYQRQELLSYHALIFILGYANGLAFQKSGNIGASVIIHGLWNFSASLISR